MGKKKNKASSRDPGESDDELPESLMSSGAGTRDRRTEILTEAPDDPPSSSDDEGVKPDADTEAHLRAAAELPPSERSWLSRHGGEFLVATLSGVLSAALVGIALYAAQYFNEEDREAAAARLENLRFVRSLSSQAIEDRPFRSLDLRGMNLSGLNLAGADFRGADLEGAQIEVSNLIGANFNGANLRGASLWGSDLIGSQMLNTDVSDVDFGSADLSGAWIDPSGATGEPPVATGPPSNWDNVTLIGATISNLSFVGAEALSPGMLLGLSLTNADVSHTQIADYRTADLESPVMICATGVRLPAGVDSQFVSSTTGPCSDIRNRILAEVQLYLTDPSEEIPSPWWDEPAYQRAFGFDPEQYWAE